MNACCGNCALWNPSGFRKVKDARGRWLDVTARCGWLPPDDLPLPSSILHASHPPSLLPDTWMRHDQGATCRCFVPIA